MCGDAAAVHLHHLGHARWAQGLPVRGEGGTDGGEKGAQWMQEEMRPIMQWHEAGSPGDGSAHN